MKGADNIIGAVHALKMALDNFQVYGLEHPESRGDKLFKGYNQKIEWIYKDIITNPVLPQKVRDGIKKEWESDVFIVDAIREKITLLNPDQRELVETLIDGMLKGESVTFV